MINLQNIKIINNNIPIKVDYNNCDEEGGVRLITQGSIDSIDQLGIKLEEGQIVWISDSEIEYLAIIIYRRGIFVAVPIGSTRNELI